MIRKLIVALVLITMMTGLVVAQTSGGQICVQAYEDRNGNGLDDAGEPRILRGLSATLANADGVIVGSALMEESPRAATGTLCFAQLPAGQYSLQIASADYTPTTPTQFVAASTETGIQVFEYGGQIIITQAPAAADDLQLSQSEQRDLMVRLIFAGIGAAVVIGAMVLVGVLIYVFVLRTPDQPVQPNYTPGAIPPVQPSVQSNVPAGIIRPDDTDQNAPIQFEDEDTNRSRPIEPVEVEDDFEFTGDDPNAAFRPPEE